MSDSDTKPLSPKEIWLATVNAAAAEYDADIYFYSGGIEDEGFGKLVAAVSDNKQRDRALLIMTTHGGSANIAYQIARLFQRVYKNNVTMFCPSRCKSAGTLVALGADRLIMDQFSELGPLDVQLIKQNEIASRKSGLLARSSFDALADASFELYERLMMGITLRSYGNVSFKIASDVSATMASQMMSGVYEQINPEIVGSEKRDLEVAREYGERLIACSGNSSEAAVYTLVYGYPSHDFIIDDEEARHLFKNVDYPTDSLYQIVGILGDAVYNEATPSVVVALTRKDRDIEHDHDDQGAPDADGIGAEQSVDVGRQADREGDSAEADVGPEREPANDSQSGNGQGAPATADVHPIRVLKKGQTDT